MSNILKKVMFLLVLAGLLTWGVATMAGSPSIKTNVADNATVRQGQVIDSGIEADRSQFQPR